jgi:hypothetical protein
MNVEDQYPESIEDVTAMLSYKITCVGEEKGDDGKNVQSPKHQV